MSDDILDSPWFAARIAEAEERGAARVRERVETVLARWERELEPDGSRMLFTVPACENIRAALTDEATP